MKLLVGQEFAPPTEHKLDQKQILRATNSLFSITPALSKETCVLVFLPLRKAFLNRNVQHFDCRFESRPGFETFFVRQSIS